MIEQYPGFYAQFQTAVNHPVIKIDALLIDFANSFRENPRPGKGKSEDIKIQILYHANILAIVMIKSIGDIRVVSIFDFVGLVVRKGVPD